METLMCPRLNARGFRQEYYGNLAVEAFQRMIAIATLIGFAVFAAVFIRDPQTSALITALAIIGLVHLAHVSRLHEGGDLVRRGLLFTDGEPGLGDDGGPYRSAPAIAQRRRRVSSHVHVRDALIAAAFTGVAIAALR